MPDASSQTTDSSANSPGAILKRCREYHGISLKEAAEATKVGENYLEALENDRIGEFASLAYLKGFLRIYATHLGLNPDDMFRLYDKLFGVDSTKTSGHPVAGGNGRPKRSIPWQRFALPALLLVMILVTAALINRSASPPGHRRDVQPQVNQPAPASRPVQQQQTTLRPVRPAAAREAAPEKMNEQAVQEQPSHAAADAGKSFIVRMKVVHNGSLNVTIDGAASQSYELAVGDVIEWKAQKNIVLELSNGGGVEAELNGVPLKPFGAAGRPVSVTVDAGGVH